MHQNTQSMYRNQPPVVGIDVGGIKKGFHAVAILEGCLLAQSEPISSPQEVAAWCTELGAAVVAIDAPSAWAHAGTSRRCERDLAVNNINVSCFSTPERRLAEGRTFYDWVRNGERLYQALASNRYHVYSGSETPLPMVVETFPHAVTCALLGRIVSARQKSATRRSLVRHLGFDDTDLSTIDHVDAALCAVAALWHLQGRSRVFGDAQDGFIVIPRP